MAIVKPKSNSIKEIIKNATPISSGLPATQQVPKKGENLNREGSIDPLSTQVPSQNKPSQQQAVQQPVTAPPSLGNSPYGKPLTGPMGEVRRGEVLRNNPDIAEQIRQAGVNKFGTINEVNVASLVNKVVNEGYPIEEAIRILHGGYGYSPDQQRAADIVSTQFDPQENALKRAMEMIETSLQRNITQQTQFGDNYDKRIQDIFGALTGQLNEGTARIQGIYGQAGQQIGQGYQQATNVAQGATDAVRQQLQGDAQRLGIEEGLSDPLTKLAAEMQALTSRNKASEAAAVGNVTGLGANMQSLGVKAIMDAQREGAQSRSNLLNEVMQGIAEAQIQAGAEQHDVLGQLTDLAGIRGAALREAVAEVEQARTEQERQAALDKLAEEVHRHTINLQNRQFGLQERQFDFESGLAREQFDLTKSESEFNRNMATADLGLRREAFELQKRELEAQIAAANSPLQQALAMAQLEKVTAEIGKLNAQTTAISSGGQQLKGQQGANIWLDQKIQQGTPPQIKQEFSLLMADAASTAVKSGADEYSVAKQLAANKYGVGTPEHAFMIEAINIFYGRHASYK